MKIQTVGTASGSVGPVTTSRNRFGQYQRNRVTPLNPQSVDQQNVRATLSSCASAWRGLTEIARQAWAAFSVALPGNLTGFNAFVKLNVNRALAGAGAYTVPPSMPSFGVFSATALVAVTTSGTLTQLDLTDAATTTPAPDGYVVEACPPVSPGISFVGGGFRVLAYAADLTELVGLETAYIAKFGNPIPGQKVCARVSPLTNGIKGVPFAYAAVVTGT